MWFWNTFKYYQIFINMKRQTQNLRIRITEVQFKQLAEALITERNSKSKLVRKALDYYLNKFHKDIELSNKEDISIEL